MKLISLNCNHCGAPLEVPEDARFVTCRFCEQKLSIELTGSVYSTRLLEQISDRTDALADDLIELKKHAELEKLERQWERDQKRFMVRNEHGVAHKPSKIGAMMVGIGSTVFGFIWMSTTSSMSGPGIFGMFPLFGLLIAGGGIASGIQAWNKADRLEKAEERYRRQRRKMSESETPDFDFPDV